MVITRNKSPRGWGFDSSHHLLHLGMKKCGKKESFNNYLTLEDNLKRSQVNLLTFSFCFDCWEFFFSFYSSSSLLLETLLNLWVKWLRLGSEEVLSFKVEDDSGSRKVDWRWWWLIQGEKNAEIHRSWELKIWEIMVNERESWNMIQVTMMVKMIGILLYR